MAELGTQRHRIARFLALLREQPRGRTLALGALTILVGLAEGVGMLLPVPLIGVLGGDALPGNPIASALARGFGASA